MGRSVRTLAEFMFAAEANALLEIGRRGGVASVDDALTFDSSAFPSTIFFS